MKKILLILLVTVFFINTAEAQRNKQTIKWFSIAAKAGIGNSVLLNMDIFDDGNISPNYITLSQSYGGRFTFTFGDNIGFGTDVLLSSFGQEYSIDNGGTIYDKDIKIKAVDILPFFRYTGNTGGYFELGGKFTTINSVTETNSVNLTDGTFNPSADIMQYYEPKFTSLVFGFGLSVYNSERIDINMGTRFAYSFSDLTPNKTYNATADGYYIPNYVMTEATNPISAQVILEVNYYFAFWGDASCGRGRLMLFK